MKIISPFKDYYDYIMAWGCEPNIVYNRTNKIYFNTQHYNGRYLHYQDQISNAIFNEFNFVNFERVHQIVLLGFCGHIIPRIAYIGKNDRGQNDTLYLWGDAAKEYIFKYQRRNGAYNNIIRLLEDKSQELRFLPLFKKYNVPVFLLRARSVEFNPSLGISKGNWQDGIGFAKYMDAQTTFQSISSFIGTELKETMIASPQTDKEKVVAHGFDKKTSFRH